jgi:sigma-B regulation protein RsbU (phosphoserine phosphatase)
MSGEINAVAEGSPTEDGPHVAALEQAIASLQAEESRVFSYLHELAEMVSADRGTRRVPELIVDGVAKVVQAAGAAIYLIDKTGTRLVPDVLTRLCPPLIALPEELRTDLWAANPARTSYLKLQAIGLDSPVLGTCFVQQSALHLNRLDAQEMLSAGFTEEQSLTPVMVAPLNYGSKRLGILVAANFASMGAFPAHAFEIFLGVAEQSAFALGNAKLQEEAMEKRRLESELHAASEVQKLLLPDVAPKLNNFSIRAINAAARIVSGDYYDFIPVDADHTGIVIADVSGKGIAASLVMTTCRGLLRGLAGGLESPSQALSKVNRMIFEDVKQDMFISLAYVMLQAESGKVILSRAGHDAPFLYRSATREISRLEPPGVALGVDAGDVFDRVTRDFEFQMEPGDCLLLYTDGVNEAEDMEGDQFGLDRLESCFRAAAVLGPAAVLEQVQAAVKQHVQDCPQSDDITLIAIQRI